MKWIALAAIMSALMFAAPARAEEAAGPSAGHPLSPLFDLIAGGKWEPTSPPYPDEFRTTMTFGWDAATASIKGTSTRMGGIAGIRQVTNITFAYDVDKDVIIVTRAPDEIQWSKIGELPKPVTGTAIVSDTGFQMRFDNPDKPGEMMITAVQFETPDLWVERSEILGNGQSTLGNEVRYARKPDLQ